MSTQSDDQAEPLHPIDRAAKASGGRPGLARALGVRVSTIGNWVARGVPIKYCARIERLCGGVVTRKDLRPDDWAEIWPELAEAARAREEVLCAA